MDEQEFRRLVEEEWGKVPSPYKERVENVALLVEDEPSLDVQEEGHALLGIYHGIPLTERGEGYGTGGTLPDTITLYRLPIMHHAEETGESIQQAIRQTLWHELGHYFGYDDFHLHIREDEGTNEFGHS